DPPLPGDPSAEALRAALALSPRQVQDEAERKAYGHRLAKKNELDELIFTGMAIREGARFGVFVASAAGGVIAEGLEIASAPEAAAVEEEATPAATPEATAAEQAETRAAAPEVAAEEAANPAAIPEPVKVESGPGTWAGMPATPNAERFAKMLI